MEVIKGGGIRGTVDGRIVAVGSRRVLATMGVGVPDAVEAHAVGREQQGNTAAFVAIAALRARGVKEFHMLTGANRHTAELVAAELGIDVAQVELLPQGKVRLVQELKAQGRRVGMVGDGINDAPAIATADVGLAMGTVRNMKQNTVIALGTAVLLLTGGLLHQGFMATGMLVHEISVLVVILNAVRLVRYRDKRAAAPTAAAQDDSAERGEAQEVAA